MDETFEKAPLVEIAVELRWATPGFPAVDTAGNSAVLPLTDPNAVEPFFHRVSAEVAKHGFDRLERLVPQGLTVLPHQMIYRYRRSDDLSVLMQVGPGQFSVNALPPYKSWAEFRPWLVKGVDALLEARSDALPFSASLRYIDAFKEDLTGGREANAFLTEVLGFHLDLPAALSSRRLVDGVPTRAALQIVLPVSGMLMAISVVDGQIGTDKAVLMEYAIQISEQLQSGKDAIITALDSARQVAHGTFLDLTESIRDKMQPATT